MALKNLLKRQFHSNNWLYLCGSNLYFEQFYELNEAIYKVIFIGLASLTFPHILLEYLIEKMKNEVKIFSISK